MKNCVMILLFLLVSFPSEANIHNAPNRSNGLLRFIAQSEGFRNFALGSVIKTRCSRYMPVADKAACRQAVQKMVQILDFDISFIDEKSSSPSSFVFVAFKTNLISLLSKSKTEIYLLDLNQELYRFLSEGVRKPNVWAITKKHFSSDYATSMVLATLFQDTSLMKLHLAYLEHEGIQGNLAFRENKELLSRVIDSINFILDTSEDNYRSLFYPKEIQKDLNRNIYHFYVPLYLSKALEVHGVQKNIAFSAAMMLTLTYEFITSAPDYRYLYIDPKRVDNDYKIKDIFGGYCGSNIGVRGMNFYKSFSVIKNTFARSTEAGVRLLLKQ